jgi:hypothetical protein
MAVFRSAPFVSSVRGQQISVGPNAILDILLNVDKEVDRFAVKRFQRARLCKIFIMKMPFSDLTVFSSALMQNLSAEEQTALISAIRTLIDSTLPTTTTCANTYSACALSMVGKDISARRSASARNTELAAKKRAAERLNKTR